MTSEKTLDSKMFFSAIPCPLTLWAPSNLPLRTRPKFLLSRQFVVTKFMLPATNSWDTVSANSTTEEQMEAKRLTRILLTASLLKAHTKRATHGTPGSVKFLQVTKNAELTLADTTS